MRGEENRLVKTPPSTMAKPSCKIAYQSQKRLCIIAFSVTHPFFPFLNKAYCYLLLKLISSAHVLLTCDKADVHFCCLMQHCRGCTKLHLKEENPASLKYSSGLCRLRLSVFLFYCHPFEAQELQYTEKQKQRCGASRSPSMCSTERGFCHLHLQPHHCPVGAL